MDGGEAPDEDDGGAECVNTASASCSSFPHFKETRPAEHRLHGVKDGPTGERQQV